MAEQIKLLDLIYERVSISNDPVIQHYLDLIKRAANDDAIVQIINGIFEVAYKHGLKFGMEMAEKYSNSL
jgi:hypothetical protein